MTHATRASAHQAAAHIPACQTLAAQFSAYLDGEASPELCAAIEAQCAACDDCRTVLATLEATRRLTYTLPAPTMPEATTVRLRACLGLPPT
jgi:anti-sigma factor RsiW